MAYHYSKRHYRLLADYGGGNDSAQAQEARKRRLAISEQIKTERENRFPVITAENFQAASDWQDARFKELENKPE